MSRRFQTINNLGLRQVETRHLYCVVSLSNVALVCGFQCLLYIFGVCPRIMNVMLSIGNGKITGNRHSLRWPLCDSLNLFVSAIFPCRSHAKWVTDHVATVFRRIFTFLWKCEVRRLAFIWHESLPDCIPLLSRVDRVGSSHFALETDGIHHRINKGLTLPRDCTRFWTFRVGNSAFFLEFASIIS